ncbi:hypothetical protein BTA51_22050 [Hahella sp. CCB-MM4]|nr:hypothetical protein BTA51_22050 [Hahella sp. CCB-MM4]
MLCSLSPTPSILMVQRAERPDDPWSGDMAFPGGRQELSDRSHEATALRELHEEVGIHIDTLPDLHLNTVWTKSHNSFRPMAVHPFVFEVKKRTPFHLSHEATDAVWIPLSVFKTESRQYFQWRVRGFSFKMPCFHYRKYRIWGLSLKMIENLLATDYFASLSGK